MCLHKAVAVITIRSQAVQRRVEPAWASIRIGEVPVKSIHRHNSFRREDMVFVPCTVSVSYVCCPPALVQPAGRKLQHQLPLPVGQHVFRKQIPVQLLLQPLRSFDVVSNTKGLFTKARSLKSLIPLAIQPANSSKAGLRPHCSLPQHVDRHGRRLKHCKRACVQRGAWKDSSPKHQVDANEKTQR